MKITEQELFNYGYKKDIVSSFDSHSHASALYQRWIRDDNGVKLYAINWYHYPEKRYSPIQESYTVNVVLYREDLPWSGHDCFHIDFTVTSGLISEVEKFIAKMYKAMECVPDLHNND